MNLEHVLNYSPDMTDYLAVMRRRKMHLIIPLVVIMFITLGAAFGLPPVYRSTASILIEQQEVPQEMVASTVTSYAEERIQLISKRVMTRENLWAIVEKFDLYPKERKLHKDPSEILSEMSGDIDLEMVNADIINSSGREGKAAMAFDLSYESRDPVAAQKVASELASLFLRENVQIRTEKAAVTSDFLEEEAKRLSKHIAELEAKLATFKEQNVGRLPELMQMNMNLMERTEQQLDDSNRQITSLKERQINLESQLSQLQPNSGDSPEGRLRALQAEYLRASAIYSPDYPDIIRMKSEIEALRAQVGAGSDTGGDTFSLENRIKQVEADLAAAREKYAENHPDVIRLEKTLDALHVALKNAQSRGTITDLAPDNPAYVSIQTQLETLKVNLDAELKNNDRLKKKVAEYENRLTQTPRVEQEGSALHRDYDNTVQKYHDIKQKELQAQVAEQLERESKGERFSLIEPPTIPSRPVKPNRLGILLLGTVFSMVGGVGFASISEALDRALYGSKSVLALLKAPPIAVIPNIKNQGDLKRSRFRVLLTVTIILVVLAVLLLTVHLFWMPLDVLVSTALANLGDQ